MLYGSDLNSEFWMFILVVVSIVLYNVLSYLFSWLGLSLKYETHDQIQNFTSLLPLQIGR